MIRGTTPTLTLRVESETINLEEASHIYVSIEQAHGAYLEKSGDYLELVPPRIVKVWLTQDESLRLRENFPAKVQINWTYIDAYQNHRRAATRKKEINIDEQLLRRVIE